MGLGATAPGEGVARNKVRARGNVQNCAWFSSQFWTTSFLLKLAYRLRFFASLQNPFSSMKKLDTFFIDKNIGRLSPPKKILSKLGAVLLKARVIFKFHRNPRPVQKARNRLWRGRRAKFAPFFASKRTRFLRSENFLAEASQVARILASRARQAE